MTKVILIAIIAFMAPALALADTGPAAYIPHPDWILFALALIITGWWSAQAFDRPPIKLAGIPTLPRYMTRPSQYQLGKIAFIILSLAIYALMVRYHTDLPQIVKAVKPDWYEPLKSIIDQKDPSYLAVIILVSACFLFLIRTERQWNFYLLFRDIIHSWVSIPYLTNGIVNLIKDGLVVPVPARSKLSDYRVHPEDFSKNPGSMDYAWAELAYLKAWITFRHRRGGDTTFFSECSFEWEAINTEFSRLSDIVIARKDGYPSSNQQSVQLMNDIATHRTKLARLIACYLVFMNASRAALIEAARKLGIDLGPTPSENPLRYLATYIVGLAMAVYLGVYFSAIIYDIFSIKATLSIFNQNTTDVYRWVLLALGDYGIPILGILSLRYLAWRISPAREYSIIVAYAWIFLISAALSTIGLSVMAELVGRHAGEWSQFGAACERSAPWSIGPALICVYINHYLDRQIDPTRPNIETPSQHLWRRLGYAMLFTILVIIATLPSMPTIHSHGPWELSKLRFISMGTIFFITMTMALIAQFALTKKHRTTSSAPDTPDNPDAQLVPM